MAGRAPRIAGFKISPERATKPLAIVGCILLAATIYTSVASPAISTFQLSNLSNGAIQADSHMSVTRKMADSTQASNYNVTPGVTYIGDSVSLRAISYLQKALPDAQIDARLVSSTSAPILTLRLTVASI